MARTSRAVDRLLTAVLLTALLMPAAACGSRIPEDVFERRREGTATSGPPRNPIEVGIISSATSPVGGGAFTGPQEGARAFFDRLNAEGGVGGRRVRVLTCDDGGSGVGNSACVQRLVRQENVFALVATTALDYAGASQVSRAGVPDIGGQPIGAAYDTYPHLYSIHGSSAPRDGRKPGWNGVLYGGTEVYRFFRSELGARTAGVVHYNQASSAAYARLVMRGLRAEGYRVVPEEVDFALPNFTAVAADLRERGVDVLFDAMDVHGNVELCKAMEDARVRVDAKVTNVQNWTDAAGDDHADAPGCRNALWVTGSSRNHDETGNPAVDRFRAAMRARSPGRPLSQWQLEGWAAAMWFTEAAKSCGAELTRACVERYMNREQPFTADGLLLPVRFRRSPEPPRTSRNCLSVARWKDGAGNGRGRWVTQGGDMTRNCFTVPQLPYRP